MTDISRPGEPTALAEPKDGVDEPTVWAELCVVLQPVVLRLPSSVAIVEVQLGEAAHPWRLTWFPGVKAWLRRCFGR
jgi:hypothetical protein